MPERIYNWKRYWYPRGSTIRFLESGYLYSPGRYNPDVVPFEAITDTPCLVLLGEPGMGKSRALEAERDVIEAGAREGGGETFWLDLRSYGSEDRLIRDLFHAPIFLSWSEGSHLLYLFLDSTDECLIRMETLASLLIDEFKKYSVERLRLRVVCRPAEWPALLESGLVRLWGQEALETARRDCPDLILMDLNLPLMDGITTTREIRECKEVCKDVPIIAITAYDTYGIREAALEAGCTAYVTKPIDFDELDRVVRQALLGW